MSDATVYPIYPRVARKVSPGEPILDRISPIAYNVQMSMVQVRSRAIARAALAKQL